MQVVISGTYDVYSKTNYHDVGSRDNKFTVVTYPWTEQQALPSSASSLNELLRRELSMSDELSYNFKVENVIIVPTR